MLDDLDQEAREAQERPSPAEEENDRLRAVSFCHGAREATAKLRTDLEYRLPSSGLPLRYIVLTREEAEAIVKLCT